MWRVLRHGLRWRGHWGWWGCAIHNPPTAYTKLGQSAVVQKDGNSPGREDHSNCRQAPAHQRVEAPARTGRQAVAHPCQATANQAEQATQDHWAAALERKAQRSAAAVVRMVRQRPGHWPVEQESLVQWV